MDKGVKRTIREIRSLKIQGARNVAKAALLALVLETRKSRAKTAAAFLSDFSNVADELSKSRPTEPMMRNLLTDAEEFAKTAGKKQLSGLKKSIIAHEKEIIGKMESDAKKIEEYGAVLVPENSLVITHCHSSTVTRILIKAKEMKKDFSVVCFETRPRFQGRKTAKELAGADLDVTLAVDGAMQLFMKKADLVLVGADSVTSRGDLINKIGTSTLAHIARMNDVSLYCAAELAKYSPKTMLGRREEIEERDPKEVWDKAPKKLKIRNPAFEATAAKYINGYITEAGVIPSQSFFALATEKLGIRLYE